MARSSSAIVVKLIADTKQYVAGMKTAEASVQSQALRLRRIGDGMVKVGSTLTKSVTLPLVAIAAASIKMAIDFDQSMSRIVGLVGLGSDEVAGMRDRVLELSGETAKSPQELADALFFITSAGLRGSEAMEALEFSAKASAAGMGETKDVARAVTASMQAYASEGMTAAQATDILVGTVRAGNLEASELAGSLGKILPTASAAGVSLEQVGGAVALLTRSGLSGSEAVTSLNQAILALNAPTTEAKAALEAAGVSSQDLQRTLQEDGLVAALQMVEEAAGGDTTIFRKLLGSSEALNAAQTLLSASNEDLDSTFGAVEDSAGLTDNAFAAFAESGGFKAKQAFAELQVALVELGDVIVPIVSKIAGWVAGLAKSFTDLPGPAKTVIAIFGGLAAAAGPLLMIGGSLVRNFSALKLAGEKGSRGAAAMTAGIRALNKALVVVAALLALKEVMDALGANWSVTSAKVSVDTEAMAGATTDQLDKVIENITAANAAMGGDMFVDIFNKALEESPAAAEAFIDAMDRAGMGTEEFRTQLDEAKEAEARAQVATGEHAEEVDALAAEMGGAADETAGLTEELDSLSEIMDELFGVHLDVEAATIKLKDGLHDLKVQFFETGGTLDQNTVKGRANRQAMIDQTDAAFSLSDAVFKETGSVEQASFVMAGHVTQLGEVLRATGMSDEAAGKYIARLLGIPESEFTNIHNTGDVARLVAQGVIQKYKEIPANKNTNVTANATQALNAIAKIKSALAGIAKHGINVTTGSNITGLQHGGPTEPGRAYLVGEEGPELRVFSRPGQIIPNHELRRGPSMMFGGDTNASVVQHITISGPARPSIFRQVESSTSRGVRAGLRAVA